MPPKKEEKKGPTEEEIKIKKKKMMKDFLKEIESHEKTVAETEQKILNEFKQEGETYTRPPVTIRQAAGEGNVVEVSNFLRKGFQVDETDQDGSTALIYACRNNHFKTATILIANGANPNHVNKHGFTPLMFAAWKGHVEPVTLLLKHNANVNAVNVQNNTALHFASLCGYPMVCLLLRKAGGKTGVKNGQKKKPVDNAGAFCQELDVALNVTIPATEVEFTKSKSIFGKKQVFRELTKMVEENNKY